MKKKLRGLAKGDRKEIGHRLFLMEEDLNENIQELTGSENEYRLRVGKYRILFELEGQEIKIDDVGQRKDIYR